MAGTPAPRQAHFAPLALRRSLRSGRDEWRGPLHPATLTSLHWLFAARSAPFAIEWRPLHPPSSLRSTGSSPLAPLRSRRSRVPNEFVSNGWQAKRRLSSVLSAVAQGAN